MNKRILISIVVAFSFSNIIKAKNEITSDSIIVNKKKSLSGFAIIESSYYAGSLLVLNNTWYKDRKSVKFHFFDYNKGYLQVDKFGHAFGSYFESYIGYHWLRNIGVEKRNALIFGGTLGLVLQTPIEIMDGTHEGWGFSWGDVAANSVGSLFVIGQELIFNEQLIKYKFSYWESYYSQNDNGYLGKTTKERILKNYNGHTYWLSMPIYKIIPDIHIPHWLSIAVGYGADGIYGGFENLEEYNGYKLPETKRYRQYLLSLDIDWTRIKTRSNILKILYKGLTFVKVPFPTLELNSKGKLNGHILYF